MDNEFKRQALQKLKEFSEKWRDGMGNAGEEREFFEAFDDALAELIDYLEAQVGTADAPKEHTSETKSGTVRAFNPRSAKKNPKEERP